MEVDLHEEWTIPGDGGYSKCGWTPYKDRKVRGKISKVVIRGEEALVNGEVVVKPGFGINIRTTRYPVDEDAEVEEALEGKEDTSDQSEASESPLPPRIVSPTNAALAGHHILSVLQFNKNMVRHLCCYLIYHFPVQLSRIFDVANRLRGDVDRNVPITLLQVRSVVCFLMRIFFRDT